MSIEKGFKLVGSGIYNGFKQIKLLYIKSTAALQQKDKTKSNKNDSKKPFEVKQKRFVAVDKTECLRKELAGKKFILVFILRIMELGSDSHSDEITLKSVKMPSIFSRIKMAKDTLSPFYYNGIRQYQLSQELLTYESAVKKLNTLQSNATVLEKARQKGKASHVELASRVEDSIKYLQRTGITLEKLDKLSIIHVSGTKGKGTTCALCESILRHHGYKTGFYSSPHLVHARERIRINGTPLSYQQFAEYFEDVFDKISNKKEHKDDMPAYFKFMTVLAFNVFIKEQVDVAIVEVGIGGEYDCTNCIRNPAVVGITSLGLDHTCILGNTITEIAWQKAGIMKPKSIAFTVPQKSSAAMQVLKERAQNRRCKLYITPPLNSYLWDSSTGFVRENENVQGLNYSLALQLANEWMKLQSPFHERAEENASPDDSSVIPTAKPFQVTKKMAEGLQKCAWPGRSQIMVRDKVTYFLDGAHTEESIKYCSHWFRKCSRIIEEESSPSENITKILIFNTTGQRDANKFLEILSGNGFEYAIFTTNKTQTQPSLISDSINHTISADEAEKTAKTNFEIWSKWAHPVESDKLLLTATITEALTCINNIANKKGNCHVLITGSLHLIGNTLSILDPDLLEPVYHVPGHLKPLQDLYTGLQAIL